MDSSDEEAESITTTTIHKKQKINMMDNYVSADQDTYIHLKHRRQQPRANNIRQPQRQLTPEQQRLVNEKRGRHIFEELIKEFIFRVIVDEIKVDASVPNWHCNGCKNFGYVLCGIKPSTVFTKRRISQHLTTAKHIDTYPDNHAVKLAYNKLHKLPINYYKLQKNYYKLQINYINYT